MLAGGKGEEPLPAPALRGSDAKKLERRKEGEATEGFHCVRVALTKWRLLFKGPQIIGRGFLLDSEEVTNKGWLPVRLDLNSSSAWTFIPSEWRKLIIFLSNASGTECDLAFNRRD